MALGLMTTGPTPEDEARMKQAALAGERDHVALEAAAADAAAETPARAAAETPAGDRPGLMGRIRRLFRRG